ncbi:glutamate--cysteine ligase [Streptomyces sp. NPDC006660]|uniref:glutamate--cysteine ligase n=1 Tax=Streptomyces sp. NPDC006660 TaxID=3156901 RepID=UPI0033EE5F6D
MRTVGVEEELLLVDPDTGVPSALASEVLARLAKWGDEESGAPPHAFARELQGQQLEFGTRPHTDMDALGAEVVRRRRAVARHAREAGASVVALATSVLPVRPAVNAGVRYRWMEQQFGLTTQEQLTCGCHVHVSVASDDEGVAVVDRIQPWLPVLTALSGNSPYWHGRDTLYSSYRSRVWGRWPMSGPTPVFGSAERYHAQVDAMVTSGVVRDRGMIYFDARLSHRYPTVEIRVADVCLEATTTRLVACLSRALVDTAARDWKEGRGPLGHGVNLLRLAAWQGARSGLDGELLHPLTMLPRPAPVVVYALLDHVREALEDTGDLAWARRAMADLLARGNGARLQRALFARTGSLRGVVAGCVRRTLGEREPRYPAPERT